MTEEQMLQQLFDDEKFTEKQMKIILAAIETFSEKGYAASSTSEIAKKAGVAEGTIFRHYKTKKELLLSIVAPIMTKIVAPFIVNDFNKVLDHKYERAEDFFRATIENRKEALVKFFPVVKIMLQEIPFQPELRESFVENIAKKTYERVTSIVKDYQDKGQLIEMPPASAARLAVTTIIGFLLTRYVLFPNLEWDDKLETERTVQFIMYGLAKKH